MKNIKDLMPDESKLNKRKDTMKKREHEQAPPAPPAPAPRARAPRAPRAPRARAPRTNKKELQEWKRAEQLKREEDSIRQQQMRNNKEIRRRYTIINNYKKKKEALHNINNQSLSTEPHTLSIKKPMTNNIESRPHENDDDKKKKLTIIKSIHNNYLIDKDRLDNIFDSIIKGRLKEKYNDPNNDQSLSELYYNMMKEPKYNIRGRTRNKH